ncbi:MAG TPA: transporter substrate-binding domain-containing protein [Magnetospirillum sp.]|nr:transporter substrate-binding domain-containing protein [Magnetospirillum sp.]
MPLKRWARVIILILLPVAADARDLRFISVGAAPWAANGDAPVGAFPDLVRHIEQRTGHAITISLQPFARVERDLETGEQDCGILMWSDTRSHLVERGEAVYPMPFGIVARRGLRLASYDDLSRLTISIIRGLSIHPRFDGDGDLRKDFDKDYQTGLQKMARGRLDAIAGALPTIAYLADQQGYADILGDRLVLTTIPLVLQCSRRSANLDVMPDLNQAIRAMAADGTIARVMADNHYQ